MVNEERFVCPVRDSCPKYQLLRKEVGFIGRLFESGLVISPDPIYTIHNENSKIFCCGINTTLRKNNKLVRIEKYIAEAGCPILYALNSAEELNGKMEKLENKTQGSFAV